MATINLGRVKPVFRGAYAGGTAYVVDDIVTSGNETFICIQASTGNATSNASYWTKLAAKGTDGTDGTDVGTTITTQGDMLYRDGSGLQRLAKGTATQILQMNSSANAPEWAAKPQGIAEADMWRLTTNTAQGSNGVLSSNLERVDDATFSKIGTGMTVSSGHWIFPSTGLWQVGCNALIDTYNDRQSYLYTNASTDGGSNYDEIAQVTLGFDSSTYTVASVYQSTYVNVTNTSNYRVQFETSSFSANGSYVRGDTATNKTTFIFIRLGDSQ